MEKKPKILIFSGGSGHFSQASAIFEFFSDQAENGWQTKIIQPKANQTQGPYIFFSYFFPSLFRFPYRLSQRESVWKAYRKFGAIHSKIVNQEIERYRPNIVATTHFSFHYAIEKALESGAKFEFFNFASDPITIHPLIFSSMAYNFVYDQTGVKLGRKYGINQNQIIPIGWEVRKQFYQSWPRAETRKVLGFKPDVFTILFCGGTGGANSTLKILPSLLKSRVPLQIIIVSGKNSLLYNFGRSFKSIFSSSFSVWESRINIKTFRFVKRMAPLIQAADLVVGKAGPNLLFDTVVCEKPFFAVTHIHGQENGNLDLIRKKKLGWVQEDSEKAIRLLFKIIEHPNRLISFNKTIQREKEYLRATEEKIINFVKNIL